MPLALSGFAVLVGGCIGLPPVAVIFRPVRVGADTRFPLFVAGAAGECGVTRHAAAPLRALPGERLACEVSSHPLSAKYLEAAAFQKLDRFLGTAAHAIERYTEHTNFILGFRGKFRN